MTGDRLAEATFSSFILEDAPRRHFATRKATTPNLALPQEQPHFAELDCAK
jgi:hypothetical protein